MSLEGKGIIIGVTGGIAAYKMPNLVSMLAKAKADLAALSAAPAATVKLPFGIGAIGDETGLSAGFGS